VPELPELEVAKKTLTPCVAGKTIGEVLVGRERAIRTPLEDARAFAINLNRRRVKAIERWGKALVFRLDGDMAMVFHFKLGALAACREQPVGETGGVAWNFTDGTALEFTDLQLSEFHLGHASELAHLPVLKSGADPLDRSFTPTRLRKLLPPGKQLKAVLMDQDVVGGIGNTYSDEILWNARLSPFRKVSSLSDDDLAEMVHQIKATLREAIKDGGETEFRDAHERHGRYQNRVHRREGKPCAHDGHPIEVVKRGRKTFYCPHCQV
jgi:formamidopyrimidine-DNA glycosylase